MLKIETESNVDVNCNLPGARLIRKNSHMTAFEAPKSARVAFWPLLLLQLAIGDFCGPLNAARLLVF